MDRLQTMKVFLAVVDEGGFTAAARHLDMSVPTVTRLVADLESYLGTRLLQRTTRRVHPTPAGVLYAQSVRPILEAVDIAFADAQGSTEALRGELRVATTPEFAEYLIAPLVRRFQTAYPSIALQVHVDASPHSALEHYDVALLSAPEGLDANFVARRLFSAEGILCAAPHYLAQHGPLQHPSDLLQHRCLLRRSTRLRRGVLQLWPQGGDVLEPPSFEGEVEPCITINHTSSLLRMAMDGAGVAAFTHNVAAPYIAQGLLQHVLPQWITGRFALLAALPSRRHMPARTKAFLDFLTEHHNHLELPLPGSSCAPPPAHPKA